MFVVWPRVPLKNDASIGTNHVSKNHKKVRTSKSNTAVLSLHNKLVLSVYFILFNTYL